MTVGRENRSFRTVTYINFRKRGRNFKSWRTNRDIALILWETPGRIDRAVRGETLRCIRGCLRDICLAGDIGLAGQPIDNVWNRTRGSWIDIDGSRDELRISLYLSCFSFMVSLSFSSPYFALSLADVLITLDPKANRTRGRYFVAVSYAAASRDVKYLY